MSELLWRPDQSVIANSNMTAFARYAAEETGIPFPDYQTLHRWSVDCLEDFWHLFLKFTHLTHDGNPHPVLSNLKMPGARWFENIRLNFAENIFAPNLPGVAIQFEIEEQAYSAAYTFDELRAEVARCAAGLQSVGIKEGDRVAGYMANVPEAVIACLACASIGAVWSSASPDFGLAALCDRLSQVAPRLVFASTHYRYAGKIFDTGKVVSALKNRIPTLETIVSVPYPVGEGDLAGDTSWRAFLSTIDEATLDFKRLPFAQPLFILFSSGTTGAPKCMVHGAGGTLLQHRKEHQLHCDLKPGDAMLFYTTCGWMMWNWQLSALSSGASICRHRGNPGYPDLSAIWQVVDRLKVTHFGTSGRFLEACMKHRPEFAYGAFGKLEKLRSILYTGSPLSEDGFRWVYQTVKRDIHFAGISGGTDIVSCFILGNPNLPVYAGEIQCKGLGVDVAAFDDQGHEVHDAPGELVCRKPLPSMPVEFLDDADGEKYRQAYFDVYPGLWRHGDYVQFTATGGAIVYGRSDATLNPGGVRIGSAEIYSALDKVDSVKGSVVIGWQPPGQADEVVVLCVVLAPGAQLDDQLQNEIRRTIRRQLSPRHVPKHIFQISEVPVTRSGKTVELSVKAILAGTAISNRNALANPQILESFKQVRRDLLLLYS